MKPVQPPLQRDADLRQALADKEEQLRWALIDKENSETDLTAKRREVTRLKTELEKVERRHTPTKDVEDVFEHWALRCSSRRPKFGEARQKAIRARLREGFSTDELKQAIDGAAKMPFVGSKGRQAHAKGGTKQVELTLILRDEANVERFMRYADAPDRPAPDPPASRPDDPFERPLERALYALSREFGKDVTDFHPGAPYDRKALAAWAKDNVPLPTLDPDEWWSVCPMRPSLIERPMRIRERNGKEGASLELTCAHGCPPGMLYNALLRLEWRRDHATIDAPPEVAHVAV